MRICTKCGVEYKSAEMFCPVDGARIIDPSAEGLVAQKKSIPPVPVDRDPLIGTIIEGRYKVLKRRGEGGMGVVYVAEHVEIEKKVALKVLRDDFSNKPDVVERFRQEARSASKVGNPHIVDVTDFGQLSDGGVFFAMELLEGEGLDELCDGVPVSLSRAAPIIDQIARALQAAHDKGIVHRDLKPENIFLVNREDQADFVKILDFGIAKISDRDSEGKRLTQTGMIFGTPEYMSPEQAAGKPLDHRVDVYALGCIMFELFTGQVPYDGDSFMAILTQHMFEPIPNIKELVPHTDVPDSVLSVVYKAMAKEEEKRYPNMTSLRDDLQIAILDSNYVVDHPERDTAVRFGTKGKQIVGGVSGGSKSRISTGLVVGITVGALAVVLGLTAVLVGIFDKEESPAVVEPMDAPLISNAPTEVANMASPSELLVPKKGQPSNEPPLPAVEKIKVTLGSIPSGAVILVEGMGQVCSSAPCEVMVAAEKSIQVTAKLGKQKKVMTFTPSLQNTDVLIELNVPSAKRPRGRTKSPTKTGGGTGSSSGNDGLKIPEVFKNN